MAYQRPLTIGQKAKIAWMAAFHRDTSLSVKGLLFGGLLYGILPIDIIPDILPLVGISDDAVVIVLALLYFLKKTKTLRRELAALVEHRPY